MSRRWIWLASMVTAAAAGAAAPTAPTAPMSVRQRAETAVRVMSVAQEDSILAAEREQHVAARVGAWARRFAAADSVRYLFGLAAGGYAAEGELVADRTQDCISLLYRCTELARARDHDDAVAVALATRFAGAPAESVVTTDGRVDYDDPAHLDFSLDMIRSGHWGDDVTATLHGAVPDSAGSARYAPGSFLYVPGPALDPDELREGDVIWLVLNPADVKARRLRNEYGLVIGHVGIAVRDGETVELVHAAVSDLPGCYEGGTVVSVPLQTYLRRVGKFAGICVTRFGDGDG